MSAELTLNESYPAVAVTVPYAREALVGFARRAGATRERIEAMRLATSEALTNVVLHAYGEDTGAVHVTAAAAEDELWVLIADDGRGLDAGSRSAGLGMGLALIACVTDYFAVMKRSSGGTEIRMRFGTGVGLRSRHGGASGSVATAHVAA